MTQAVRAALTTSPPPDRSSPCGGAVVRLFGTVAGVAYTADRVETARRDLIGLGPLVGRDLLNVLLGLPLGLPVATADLSPRERQVLATAPTGVLDHEDDHLIRKVGRPVTPRFAVISARSWRAGLVHAGRFAPFCARAILLPETPTDLADARVEASFYGIGVCTFAAGALQMLVDPEPFVCARHSPTQWWFAEEIYRQISERSSAAG